VPNAQPTATCEREAGRGWDRRQHGYDVLRQSTDDARPRRATSRAMSNRHSEIGGGAGGFVLSGSADKTLKLWELPRKGKNGVTVEPKTRFTVRAHEKDINAVAVAPNDALVSPHSCAQLFELRSLEMIDKRA
jgi:WD40 repeat protein